MALPTLHPRLPKLRLPDAPAGYSRDSEAVLRRAIEQWAEEVVNVLTALSFGPESVNDANRGFPFRGRTVYNTDDEALNFGDGTNWQRTTSIPT